MMSMALPLWYDVLVIKLLDKLPGFDWCINTLTP